LGRCPKTKKPSGLSSQRVLENKVNNFTLQNPHCLTQSQMYTVDVSIPNHY